MPVDLREVLDPAHSAVLVIECQVGIIDERSPLRDLAQSVRDGGMLETLSGLLASARSARVPVFHCPVERRRDGLGQLTNTPIGARMLGRGSSSAGNNGDEGQVADGSVGDTIVPELRPEPQDIVAARDHGLTVFHETGLDGLLRSIGVHTLVVTGVSINIAITGATIDAVNRGYNVVIPSDCVAGAPADFARDALRYSLRNLAFLSTAEKIRETWEALLAE